jgi:hypothetical protein
VVARARRLHGNLPGLTNRARTATTTAPVPPSAKGPAIPKYGYLVEEIAERTFWLTDGLYQMIFLATAEGVVAIDARHPRTGPRRLVHPAVLFQSGDRHRRVA